MRNSFQEQMLKLGLVDKKKINEVKKGKYKEKIEKKKVNAKKLSLAEENALLVQKAAEKKKERDLQLNKERERKLQKRAENARVKQLIEQNKLAKDEKNGYPFRFNVSGKIHRILVDSEAVDKLGRGVFGIVEKIGFAEQFEVVPKNVVVKIRSSSVRIFTWLADEGLQESTGGKEGDDPYAEYIIPDDLMW